MYKTLLSVTCLTAIAVLAHAQKPPVKFGDVSLEEVKMTTYEKDTSAAAVVLVDYGTSTVTYQQGVGFMLNFDRITRIKILKKAGFDWANFTIPLYKENVSSKERVSQLKVLTHNLVNGKIETTKVKNDAIFQEDASKHIDLVKVSAPQVVEGSVVEISYRVNSQFLFNFQDWTFQSTIPIVWSEYRALIPEFFHYNRFMQGYIGLEINEESREQKDIILNNIERQSQNLSNIRTSGNASGPRYSQDRIPYIEHHFRWAAKDVPAFHEEPYLTTYLDYLSSIKFQLAHTKFPDTPIKTYMESWPEISRKLWDYEDFGGQVRGNGFLEKIVESIVAPEDTPEQKIAKIYRYVTDNVSWNGHQNFYSDGTLKRVLEEKKGSTADINLLLTSMLAKAKLDAYPVAISTRDHGFIRQNVAMIQQFNYVICRVKLADKVVLLDATSKFLPPGVLPEKCLNGQGLVVDGEQGAWVELSSPVKSRTVVESRLELAADDELLGTVDVSKQGYPAHQSRESYTKDGEDKHIASFLAGKMWTLNEKSFENVKDILAPFREHYELSIEDVVTRAGDVLYIDPLFMLRKKDNPFRLEKREYPVDFGSPFDEVFMFKVKIPDGYTIDEMPESRVFMMPENKARFTYNVLVNDGCIHITSMLSINRAIFSQLEYPDLREFFKTVVAKQAEQIVMKKT